MSKPYILTINVRYHNGPKATQFFSKASSDANAQLKKDLQKLKFPTPAECNITFVSPGDMKAIWITTLTSRLYKQLKQLVHGTKSTGMPQFLDSVKSKRLDIEWITLEETPVDSDATQYPDYTRPNSNGTISSIGGSVQGKKRGHSTNSSMATDRVLRSSTSTSSHFRRASDGSPSKRSRIDVNGRDRSSESANQARRTFVSSQTPQIPPFNQSRPRLEHERRRSDSQTTLGSVTRGGNDARRSNDSVAPSVSTSSTFTSISERTLNGKNLDQVPSTMNSVGPMSSTYDLYNPLTCLPRVWQSYSTNLTEMEQKLENEKGVRRKLEESFVTMQGALDAAQSRLSDVGTELRTEQERREELEKELAGERKRRIEVENILNDIERECRAPFVVPAMLEAFKTISTLTTWTMDIKTSSTT